LKMSGLSSRDATNTPGAEPRSAATNFGARAAEITRPNRKVDPRLIVQSELSALSDGDLQLGAGANVQAAGLALEIIGLPRGITMPAGRPLGANGWRISGGDAAGAVFHPPPGFFGAIDLVVELRRADDTIVDSDVLRREWKRNVASTSGSVQTPTTDDVPDK